MLSLPLLLAVLVAVPGVLIPLLVSSRLLRVLSDARRGRVDRAFAGGTILLMVLLMGIAVYAAVAIFGSVSALSGPAVRS